MVKQRKYFLVINCGSSSIKFRLFSSTNIETELSGAINHIDAGSSCLEIRDAQNEIIERREADYEKLDNAVTAIINWFKQKQETYTILAISHRVVQGGPNHRQPEIVTDKLLQSLNQFIFLAPNHLPDEIKTIKTFKAAFPGITQVVCFDTAFHSNMPDKAKYYALPKAYRTDGLIRYGFHGLSYEYIIKSLHKKGIVVKKQKIIIAHLGNGASMAAVKHGIGIDTTMGLSPMGGLVMATRSGDLDPGVILFLLKNMKMTPHEVDELLSKQAGLKAISGMSDMQELLKSGGSNPDSKEAITIFCYQAQKFIGALAAAMGGLDQLVFTGGIGENSAIIRQRICKHLDFIGINIHKKSNHGSKAIISAKNKSKVIVHVIKTNEEWMIAKHTNDCLKLTSNKNQL